MPHPKIVFRITLPEQIDPDEFETFMKDRYFPAVRRLPTRVGQVTALDLWRKTESSGPPARTFLMEYGFSGLLSSRLPRVDDPAVVADFEAYSPYFEPLGPFMHRAAGSEDSPSTIPAQAHSGR